jgi:hypothetical protein
MKDLRGRDLATLSEYARSEPRVRSVENRRGRGQVQNTNNAARRRLARGRSAQKICRGRKRASRRREAVTVVAAHSLTVRSNNPLSGALSIVTGRSGGRECTHKVIRTIRPARFLPQLCKCGTQQAHRPTVPKFGGIPVSTPHVNE